MAMIKFLLLLIGFVCFVVAMLVVQTRINMIAAGLAAWILVYLIEAFPGS